MSEDQFTDNCNAFPPEQLAAYENQYVAWSLDGRRLLAHAPELAALHDELRRRELTDCVVEFIPARPTSSLGGYGL